MPIEALSAPEVRGEFKTWRDTMADTPRKADYAWTVLARLLSSAMDRGKIATNPCERGGRLYKADRSEVIWTEEHIKEFCSVASFELPLWTGQRQGDLLRLTWNDYDFRSIRLRQKKGAKRVTIPVRDPLKSVLDAIRNTDLKATTILTNSRGKPWTEDGFRTSWGKAFDKSGIADDLHFHDLRGTAITRLALADCTIPEIAAITGHSLKTVDAILQAHYLGGTTELAEAAILKYTSKFGT
jgi:integrase